MERGLFDSEPAVLVLEDGTFFAGECAVAGLPAFGEVVFNTSLAGYQEVVSDPSYSGQLVTMTYPHIGNYGSNADDDEARSPACAGLIVRSLSRVASSHRSTERFDAYLERHRVPCGEGIDTRRLTRHLRDKGAMTGGLFCGDYADADSADLLTAVEAAPGIEGRDLVAGVTTREAYRSPFMPEEPRYRVALVDFGVKTTILRRLADAGCEVVVFPASTSADELLAMAPHGVMLSNGPGDPAAVDGAPLLVRHLLGHVPVFGICLGHQVLGLALGAETVKLPFGHHGGNHPVMDLTTGRVEITAQNHGFAVRLDDMAAVDTRFGPVRATHKNLNDGTLEGLECIDVPAFGVQYHPEAGPGPHDATHLFERFTDLMESHRAAAH